MRTERILPGTILALVTLLAAVSVVHAQVPATAVATNAEVAPAAAGGVDVTADRLEYESERKLMIGIGNVVVRHGPDVLEADCVTVHTETKEAYATGNVHFERGGKVWEGEELEYNFESGRGNFHTSDFFMDPFYVRSEGSKKLSNNEILLDHAIITTCDGDDPGFYVKTSSARVYGESAIRARNVWVFLGPVPVFYMPYAKYDVERRTDFDFLPGYSSRWGAYALMAYNYRLNPRLTGHTHLDYRSRRGLGYGQDFRWSTTNTYAGKLFTYYTDDDEPYRDKEEQEEDAGLVEEERYRLRLQHKNWYTDRLTLNIDAHYLSDPDVLEDFFREEYREHAEPDNRAVLTYRGDAFTAALKLEGRVNDFYETVDRMPEASLDVPRIQVGQSGFYYESENSAVALERQFTELSGDESYDAFRVDSSHMLFYPTRHFGFLNIIPRAGMRMTHYSKTREETTVTNLVTVVETNVLGGVTNTISSLTNETSTIVSEGGADMRNLLELGVGMSFKAFKIVRPATLGKDGGLRHVVEPYTDYRFRPEPNLTPDELYQFDDIDELDESHRIRLGMRNKWQTKQGSRIHDLVDIDVRNDYRLETDEDENEFGPLIVDCELRPSKGFKMDFDGEYDWDQSEATEFNAQVALIAADETSLAFEYRYLLDRRDQVAGELTLFPNMRWSLGAYVRYDLDISHVEEQGYYIQRQTDCIGWAVGYEGRGSDWDFTLRLWLAAFPESSLGAEGHY